MAASLFRRGTGLCCIQRELCRVVWRPQTALFSSKPPDRKQPPRRTHIKKAKPKPAVDVAKLLEQLFHQRRPGTAPPVARPTKPPTASSMNVSASNVPPLSKTKPEETSSFPAASVEPLIETTIESPVELILSHPVEEVQTKSTDVSYSAKVEPLIETTVEARHSTVGTLETRAAVVEGPVEPPIDVTVYVAAREVETESTDSGGVAVSHTTTVEPLIETTAEPASEKSPSLLETLENRSAVAEGSVEATIETEEDTAALSVQTNSTDSGSVTLSHAAEEEPLIETTIEPPVGASHFTVGTIETIPGAVEPPIDVTVDLAAHKVETKSTDSGPVHLSHAAEEEPLIETAIEPAVEASASPVSEGTIEPAGESVNAAVAEGGNRSEEMTLESVTLAEVEASLGTLEKESLSQTTDLLEKAAEIIAGEQRTEAEDVVPPEETSEALSLAEDLQMDALVMEELLFSVPAPVSGATGGQIGREAVRADTPDAPGVTDDLKEVLLEEVEEEEEGTPSGNEDGQETHADLDPVQRLFLEKIKEYNNMRRLNGGLLEAEPDYEKYLSEETAKLRRLYGGGDLSSFPQFTFTEPQLDQDSK